jgi:predicted permease
MVMVTPEVWVPTGVYESVVFDARNEGAAVQLGAPGFHALIVVARLADGASIDSLGPAMDEFSRQLSDANPADTADYALELAPLSRLSVSTRPQTDDELTGFTSVLLALAGVVLLIASFNLANMLLARGRARSREFALRAAIGGSRFRLVRQLLTENLVLSLIGGVAGLILSVLSLRLMLLQMPAMLPISLTFDPTPDVRIVGATIAFSVLAALLFGLGPAWRFARTDPMADLKDQPSDLRGRRTWLRWLTTRDALMTGQLALAFVMLTAAGLFARGAVEAARSDPGFTLERGLIANLDTSFLDYSADQSRAFYAEAVSRVRTMPGVASAGLASHMPFGEFESQVNVQKPGAPLRREDPAAADGLVGATEVSVSRDYFQTMGIAVLAGRDFTDAEAASPGGESIAIVDETLARQLFGDANIAGQLIQTSAPDDGPPPVLRVVGVVSGVRASLFDEAPRPFIYFPFGQQPRANAYLHARTTAVGTDAEAAMLPSVRSLLASVVPAPPIVSLETRPMFRERNLLLAIVRTGASIFVVFGVAALFLAAVGVYGVKSYLVAGRTREIGIRVALGAEPRDVVRMVLREGLMLVSVGLVAGAGLSILTGMGLRSVLFQGRALDLPVVAIAAVTLLAAMLLASWLPARRATRVAPTTALRTG